MLNKKPTMRVFIDMSSRPLTDIMLQFLNKTIHNIEQEHGATHTLEFEIRVSA